jgi:hypothetical protein
MAYANRRVYLGFPDLTEDGDTEIHVIVKNPKVVPLDEIQPADMQFGPDGQPVESVARAGMYKVISSLILAGHVYDATVFDEDDNEPQQPMRLPLSPDDVGRLPWEIIKRVTDLIQEVVNPN